MVDAARATSVRGQVLVNPDLSPRVRTTSVRGQVLVDPDLPSRVGATSVRGQVLFIPPGPLWLPSYAYDTLYGWLPLSPEKLAWLRDYDAAASPPEGPEDWHLWLDTGEPSLNVWDPVATDWKGIGGGGGSVAVDDDGTEVVGEASRLNFGDGLSVTDDGGGEVTIDADRGAHAETVGDGTEVTFDVIHGLGTTDVQVVAYDLDADPSEQVDVGVLLLDDGTVRVVFPSAPTADGARVVVLASGGSGGGGGGTSDWAEVPLTMVPSMVSSPDGTVSDPENMLEGHYHDGSTGYTGLPSSETAGVEGNRKHVVIDLGVERTVTTIRVVPYVYTSGGRSYYGPRIRVSLDGATWETLLEVPETEKRLASHHGYRVTLPAGKGLRYIEYGTCGSDANAGNHIQEFTVTEFANP